MTKREMTETILNAKDAKGVSWAEIAKAVGLSEVYTTSACLGENSLSSEEAGKLAGLLGLNASVTEALTRPATKGEAAMTVPKEPLQYRFQVSGDPLCLRRDAERVDRREVRAGDHERDRLHPEYREAAGPERRPRRDHDERQVPSLQEVVGPVIDLS